jgi:hypothetical protein
MAVEVNGFPARADTVTLPQSPALSAENVTGHHSERMLDLRPRW